MKENGKNVEVVNVKAKGDIKRIFYDHWDAFIELHRYKVRGVVIKEVKKMLRCVMEDTENGY